LACDPASPFFRSQDLRILVTNDDGIYAEGLWALARSLQDVGDVHVVAPDRDQSGIGTAKTLLTIIRSQEVPPPVDGVPTYSVQGTPTDCVILAVESLFSEPFDLLVSGINAGANMGVDLFSSGTFAAALYGRSRDIPSMAVSVSSLTEVKYDVAAQVARTLARRLLENPALSPPLLNVNLPNTDRDGVKGVQVTQLAPKAWSEGVEIGHDSRRRTYYWIRYNKPPPEAPPEGTDVWAILNDRVSITPIDLNATNGASPDGLHELAAVVTATLGLPDAKE